MLNISDTLSLPLDVVTEPIGILAVRRAGKSNLAVVMAEEMSRNHLHWVAIDPKGDWWGIRSSADGKGKGLPIPIFGGSHGDVPLEPGAGQFIADLIVDQRMTCVLDVSGFASEGEKIRFLLAFGDRLFRRKDGRQEPTHVFFEEADDYIPQRPFHEQARLVHVMARILKQGGSRGLGGTIISQRSAVVNKDVLTQVQTLFALRTTSPQDRKAIAGWVSFVGENPEIIAQLPNLPDGEAWVWSPNWLKITRRIKVHRRSTFDSGATPKSGGSRQAPATLANIDLSVLRERMAESIKRAEEFDPKILKGRIAELERRLRQQPRVVDDATIQKAVGVAVKPLRAMLEDYQKRFIVISRAVPDVSAPIQVVVSQHDPVIASDIRRESVPSRGRVIVESSANGSLPKGERAILSACIQHSGCGRDQLTVLTGYKRSTRDAYIQRLQERGYICVGSTIVPNESGIAALPDVEPLPTGERLREFWMDRLPLGERAILEILIHKYPKAVERDTLTDRTGYKRSTRDAYLQRLQSRRLVEILGRGDVSASSILFE